MFRRLLERHRRDDGTKWGGKSLERATHGYVSRQWIGHLKSGRIKEPGFGKIVAISRAMGVPLEAWLEDPPDHRRP
jgi:hypothetical protein